MAKIYTKTGDSGKTCLVSGSRILKSDDRIALYGEVDDLNSKIGFFVSLLQIEKMNYDDGLLQSIQSSLFDLGSNLACEVENRSKYKLPTISKQLIFEIEKSIDIMDEQLEPLKHFILPGGVQSAAFGQIVRTSCRRVERMLVQFNESTKEDLPENSLELLNRLSDYFFVFSRYINMKNSREETKWIPFSS